MSEGFIGGVDIGGTKVSVTLANEHGLCARIVEKTVKTGTNEALGFQVLKMLDRVCGQAEIAFSDITAVGVASAGPFQIAGDKIELVTPNICGGVSENSNLSNDWTSVPLERVLRARLTDICIENDCVAALIAERNFGALRGRAHCAYVTWSTGIGFGLCVDGIVLRGKSGNAGHGGHMLMTDASTALCGCGNQGDLEALISGRNLGGRYRGGMSALFEAARKGDASAVKLTEEAARWFGRALYNLTALLDIEAFAIGGAVWAHQYDYLMPFIHDEVRHRFPALTKDVIVVPTELGNFVADLGALGLVMPPAWKTGWLEKRVWEQGVSNS